VNYQTVTAWLSSICPHKEMQPRLGIENYPVEHQCAAACERAARSTRGDDQRVYPWIRPPAVARIDDSPIPRCHPYPLVLMTETKQLRGAR
jgi:hypothetical protein